MHILYYYLFIYLFIYLLFIFYLFSLFIILLSIKYNKYCLYLKFVSKLMMSRAGEGVELLKTALQT